MVAGADGAGWFSRRANPLSLRYSTFRRQREPVPQRAQIVALRHLVRRAEHADERHSHPPPAVVELALVHDGQQRIEDGGTGL